MPTAMSDIIQIKYFTKSIIEKVNRQALADGRRNTVNDSVIHNMNDATLYPVQDHDEFEGNIRTRFVLNEKGDTILFDLTAEEWSSLPYKDIAKPGV